MIELAPEPIIEEERRAEHRHTCCHTYYGGVTLCGRNGCIGLSVEKRIEAGGYPGGRCSLCGWPACERCLLEVAYLL